MPGDNLLSMDGLAGLVGVWVGGGGGICSSGNFSGTGTAISFEVIFRAFAMTLEVAIAFFKVSDGEL